MSKRSILRSTFVVSVSTALSRVLGLVREILMGWFFGTTLAKSAFDVAFRIPNLFRRLFGEGALSSAFIPVLTETIEVEGFDEANKLTGRVLSMAIVALMIIAGVGVLLITAAMPFVSFSERAAAVLPLLRIMLPYMFFICLVALCMAMLNSVGHFAVPALTPVLLNVVWILVLLLICPKFGESTQDKIYVVAWGILAAGAIQMLFQIPVLSKHKFRAEFRMDWNDAKVLKILSLMGPAALGMGIYQVNFCMDGVLALIAADWAPAALTFAERLIYLPLGIFATALGTVLLPSFSRLNALNAHNEVKRTISGSMQMLMIVMIPAAVGLAVLAGDIVRLIYEWSGGKFDDLSAIRTARALRFYAPGLVVFSFAKVILPVFYSDKDTITPFRVGLYTVLLNFVLNIIFVLTWPYEYKHAGLATATVIASTVNCIVLSMILTKRIGDPGWTTICLTMFKSLLASVVMGIVVYVVSTKLGVLSGKTGQLIQVLGAILSGIGVYLLAVFVLCRDELRLLRNNITKRDKSNA